MDGNLLDPDNADATLAKEWNLPELPAGVQEKLLFQTVILNYNYILFKVHQFASLLCTQISSEHNGKYVRLLGENCGP